MPKTKKKKLPPLIIVSATYMRHGVVVDTKADMELQSNKDGTLGLILTDVDGHRMARLRLDAKNVSELINQLSAIECIEATEKQRDDLETVLVARERFSERTDFVTPAGDRTAYSVLFENTPIEGIDWDVYVGAILITATDADGIEYPTCAHLYRSRKAMIEAWGQYDSDHEI